MARAGTRLGRPPLFRGLGAMLGFGAAVNLLALMAPLFMLVLYDQVLPAGDGAGLVALLALALGVHAIMAGLDAARLRISARIGAGLGETLHDRLAAVGCPGRPAGAAARAEAAVAALCRPLSGPLAAAVSDLPWTPILLLAVFAVHPALGWLALAGGAVLLSGTLALQRPARAAAVIAANAGDAAAGAQARLRLAPADAPAEAERAALSAARAQLRDSARIAAEATGNALAFGRGARMALHAGLLAAGAGLVMHGAIGTGAMLAVAILAMRAFAPLDIVAMQFGQLAAARGAWRDLAAMPGVLTPRPGGDDPEEPPWLVPELSEGLEIVDAAVVPPGASGPALQRITLRLRPGEVLGVTGASGAGKSLLGALAAGRLQPVVGCVILGGVPLARIAPDRRAALVGYLPQRVAPAPGTVAQNVALARPQTDRGAVARALRRAGLSEALARLPDGAATCLAADGAPLSAGGIERLGLARALLGRPALVILDTPLPSGGPAAAAEVAHLARDLAADGAMVIRIAPAIDAPGDCDRVLVLYRGMPVMAGAQPDPTPAGPAVPAGAA